MGHLQLVSAQTYLDYAALQYVDVCDTMPVLLLLHIVLIFLHCLNLRETKEWFLTDCTCDVKSSTGGMSSWAVEAVNFGHVEAMWWRPSELFIHQPHLCLPKIKADKVVRQRIRCWRTSVRRAKTKGKCIKTSCLVLKLQSLVQQTVLQLKQHYNFREVCCSTGKVEILCCFWQEVSITMQTLRWVLCTNKFKETSRIRKNSQVKV